MITNLTSCQLGADQLRIALDLGGRAAARADVERNVATKGLDHSERCEASLVDAPCTRREVALTRPAARRSRLISPDPDVKAAAQAQLPAEFYAWDAGDLFASLCEIGMTWRRPEEGRLAATASNPKTSLADRRS